MEVVGWVCAFGGAWLLMVAGVGKLLSQPYDLSVSAGGTFWHAPSRLVASIEVACSVAALSPVSWVFPEAIVLAGISVIQIVTAIRSPGMKCGCYGGLVQGATYSVRQGCLYLVLAISAGATAAEPGALLLATTDGLLARLAGLSVPLIVLASTSIASLRRAMP